MDLDLLKRLTIRLVNTWKEVEGTALDSPDYDARLAAYDEAHQAYMALHQHPNGDGIAIAYLVKIGELPERD